jgi:DNA polymerase-3 subunit delta'
LGQQKPIKLLTTLLRHGTIPHALLFSGIDGIGKQLTAMAFAMACNCLDPEPEHLCEGEHSFHTAQNRHAETNPCGNCRSCRKIQSGNHPDIIIIEPSGLFIRIRQIRALCHTLAMKPLEARLRVVIISDSQAMNPAAGNALLKVLEEPPDQTILILTARHPSDLFPTIVSRCQHIRFNPITRKNIMTILIEKEEVHPDDAAIIATMASGSLSKALFMIGSQKRTNWIRQRKWLIDEIDSLTSRPIVSLLAFAAKLSKNKEILPQSLEVIKSYFRDLVVCKYCPEKIINRDLQSKIQKASQKISTASLLSKINSIQSAQRDIQINANLRLTLEVLVMRLATV